ncbi:MAG: glycosyltransferase [Oscillospiraceae bacterium]|nr:glycosyltransferase [Oscillospiraceae bacterium]
MRVCLLNDSFPPVLDGVANVVTNYAECLVRDHGAEVAVGTPRYPGADYGGYPYRVLPYRSFDTSALFSGYRTGDPFSARYLAELADFGPELIHTHCPAASTLLARLLREETGAPVVFTYHTKYDVDIERVLKVKLAAHEAIRSMITAVEACDEVWTVSRGAGENLEALGYGGAWRVMPNGVDFARGRAEDAAVEAATGPYGLPPGVPVFLFVGRLMTYKGLPLVLEALRRLNSLGRDFRMVFVGKGPDRELLEEKAAALGIGDKCVFTGPVYDREALRAWNTRADLFLFPSTFDTNGLVVREAAACGLASVLIRGSCAAEGITDGRNGFTVEETPEALAALLERIMGDRARLRETGQRAMEEIYLSWADCVDMAYERYGAILEEKKAGRLPEKRRLPADLLLSLAAKSLEERERRRRGWAALLESFRESAVGMMENIQEAETSASSLRSRLLEQLKQEREEHRRR